MRRFIYALIPALVGIALRLYPTVVSGLPFSTDAWPLIRNTELLLERTPISLGDDRVFDGYNNYWPASSLFGAVLSLVTGLRSIDAMRIGVPLTGALAIVIFYALVNRVSRDPRLAFLASMLLATAFPYALITSGVTKETYANPLYILAILIFLGPGRWSKVFLFTVASVALALAHHLTPLVAIAVLACMAFAMSIRRIRERPSVDKFSLLLLLILVVITASYLATYAQRGLKLTLAPSDWLSVASYQIVAFALCLFFVSKPLGSRTTILLSSGVVALTSLSALISTRVSVLPGAPRLPGHYLLYAVPFILVSLLAVQWLRGLSLRSELYAVSSFWLSTILGLEGYAAFGGSATGLTLAYRTIDFLWPPLAVISAFVLLRLYKTTRGRRWLSLTKIVAVSACVAIVGLNSYSLYAGVSLQERYLGYFWLYRPAEYEAAAWTAAVAGNQVVAADVKVSYLLGGYYDTRADPFQGMRYLYGSGPSPQVLFLYNQMTDHGYVVYGGLSVDLPGNWVERISELSLIYSNGFVRICAK